MSYVARNARGRLSAKRTLFLQSYPYGYPPQRSTDVVINFRRAIKSTTLSTLTTPAISPTVHEEFLALPLETEVNNIVPGSLPGSPLGEEQSPPPFEEGEDCDDRCINCGTDELNFVKTPSKDPDCHISYCGSCSAIICPECCVIGPHSEIPKEDDIFCIECFMAMRITIC